MMARHGPHSPAGSVRDTCPPDAIAGVSTLPRGREGEPAATDAITEWRDGAPKRRQIVDGAAAVFNECGYDGASMSRIAEEAGVSKGTLYNYFVSKSDLFAAFVEREASDKRASIFTNHAGSGERAAASEPADESIETLLRGIGRRLLAALHSPSAQTMFRIIISEAIKFPELARIYYEAGYSKGCEEMAAWLTVQAARGHLTIDDPVLAADQFVALCKTRVALMANLNLMHDVDQSTIEGILDAAIDMFLNTYGTARRGMAERDRRAAEVQDR